jgi:hypothetical protein
MPKQCCAGCLIRCSFGIAPSTLNILPINAVNTNTPAANIMDYKPFLNIISFGSCNAPTNPLVIANFGAPAPCIPIITAPWFIGAINVNINNIFALNESSMCICAYGGVIKPVFAGQITTNVG